MWLCSVATQIETEYRLDELVTAIIGADGTARVINIGPKAAMERWEINNMSVYGAAPATLQVFRGNDTGRQIDITVTAENDTSDSVTPLQNGEVISLKWTVGTVGAIMNAHIEGSRFVKGQRAY